MKRIFTASLRTLCVSGLLLAGLPAEAQLLTTKNTTSLTAIKSSSILTSPLIKPKRVKIGGALVLAKTSTEQQAPSVIRLAERLMYLKNATTGDLVDKTLTQLDGKFVFFTEKKGSYQVCWKVENLADGCSRTFAVDTKEVMLGNQYIAPKNAYVYGTSLMSDGRPCWLHDAFFKVDLFTQVSFIDSSQKPVGSSVKANVAGEYVLGFPDANRYRVAATCEKTEKISKGYFGGTGGIAKVDLPLPNYSPSKVELAAFFNGRGVTGAPANEVVKTRLTARDQDGHGLAYEWKLLDGAGNIAGSFAEDEEWQLPSTPGMYSAYVMAKDNHGGYLMATLPLQVGMPFVYFSGRVIDEVTGTPISGADVTVLGEKTTTDNQGWFNLTVPELSGQQRYPLTIHRFDYATYGRVLDKSSRGNTYALIQAQVTQHDPSLPIDVTDTGSSGPCGFGDTQRITHKAPERSDKTKTIAQLRFADRKCEARGGRLQLPAGALVYKDQSPAQGPISMAMATINPARRAMTGDYRAISRDIGEAELESFGAIYAEFRDKFGNKINLKEGTSAALTVPLSPELQSKADTTIDMWSYNEDTGYWDQMDDAVLKNTPLGVAYVGKTTHFSTINMDVAGNDPAGATCVRLELGESLTSQNWSNLVLRAYVTYGGVNSQVKETALDNAQYHAVYRIPYSNPPAGNTLRLELRGTLPSGSDVVLLDDIINTDLRPKMTGTNLWPDYPYTECGDPIVLEADAVNLPAYGDINGTGRPAFLTGINGGYLPDPSFDPEADYYDTIDPANTKTTLGAWWSANGFNAVDGSGGTRASYMNHNDLGFGRDMHCSGTSSNYACYVTNYGLPDQNPANADDAVNQNLATQGATVTMEYHSSEGTNAVSFYAFGGGGAGAPRIGFADLDGLGPKPIPQLCTVCHGGFYNDAAEKVNGAFFREFDLPSFKYSGDRSWDYAPSPDVANLSNGELTAFKTINTDVAAITVGSEIATLINSWYATPGAAPKQLSNAQVAATGWGGDADMYRNLFASTCRTCHAARPFSMDTYAQLQSSDFLVCGAPKVMPNAYITYKNFWSDLVRVDLYRTAVGDPNCGD